MRTRPPETARRISTGLVGYAALLLLIPDLGPAALDLLWAGLTIPVGLVANIGSELLASTDAVTGGPLFTLAVGLAGAGLAAIAALLIWPLTVQSSAPAPRKPARNATASIAGAVVALPGTEPKSTDPAEQRRAA